MIRTDNGAMIPLVVGSAGHELGMNSMSGASIDKDEIYSNSYSLLPSTLSKSYLR